MIDSPTTSYEDTTITVDKESFLELLSLFKDRAEKLKQCGNETEFLVEVAEKLARTVRLG
jgi:hypothetical protein